MKRIACFAVLFLLLICSIGCRNAKSTYNSDNHVSSISTTEAEKTLSPAPTFSSTPQPTSIPSDKIVGTWKASACVLESGESYSVQQLEAFGNLSLSNFYFVFKVNGQGTLVIDDEKYSSTWSADYRNVIIGGYTLFWDNGALMWNLDGNTIVLEKLSDSQDESTVHISSDPFVGNKHSFTDLKVSEIGKTEDIYVGLQYVKAMSYLPTNLGKEDITEGYEVILAFFEFYNSAELIQTINPDEITCYADGTQVSGVKTYIKVSVDGVSQFHRESIDPGCQLLSVQDYEVPKGWKEIKFFYQSECIWTVYPEDVRTENYQKQTLFSIDSSKGITAIDYKMQPDGYEILFKGVTSFHKKSYYSSGDYVVFKFHINNLKDEALDTGLMGYKMRAYHNNCFIGDASYTLKDKIDGYINIFDVDKIEPGMGCDIYIAFETDDTSGGFYLAYDDGYITSNLCGYVYACIN